MSGGTADPRCEPVTWRRTVVGVVPSGVRSAVLVGTWLALTALFLVGGVVLVGTAMTAAGRVPGPIAGPLAVVGTAGIAGLSPTLARVTLAAAVDRFRRAADRADDALLAGRGSGSRDPCRTTCCP